MADSEDIKGIDVINALISHAASDGLGEEVAWPDVEILIMRLIDNAYAPTILRRQMAHLNDAEVALTLADWFDRAADLREADAEDAARPSDKVLTPLQRVSVASAGSAALLIATATLSVLSGAIMTGLSLLVAGFATLGRVILSRREDRSRRDARTIRRLADIARDKGSPAHTRNEPE